MPAWMTLRSPPAVMYHADVEIVGRTELQDGDVVPHSTGQIPDNRAGWWRAITHHPGRRGFREPGWVYDFQKRPTFAVAT